ARHHPDLTHAAAHLVGFGLQGVGKRRQLASEVDQVAIAVLPVVEEGEVLPELVEAHLRSDHGDVWDGGIVHQRYVFPRRRLWYTYNWFAAFASGVPGGIRGA